MQSLPAQQSGDLSHKLDYVSMSGHVTFLRSFEAANTSPTLAEQPIPPTANPSTVVQQHQHHTYSHTPLNQPHISYDVNSRPTTTVLLDTRQPIRPPTPVQQPLASAANMTGPPRPQQPMEHLAHATTAPFPPLPRPNFPLKCTAQPALEQHTVLESHVAPHPSFAEAAKLQSLPAPAAPSVPPVPVLDAEAVSAYTPAAGVTVPSTPQLQHQLQHGLSVPEMPKLDAVEEVIYQVTVQAESDKDKQQYQKEPANAASTLTGSTSTTLQSSVSPTFTVDTHLMDGVHVPVPADAKEHRVTQAYTETEVPVPGKDGKEAMEVRRVWEERVDDGEWTVVREEKAVLVDGKEA